MADSKISALPPAATLTGSELVPVVQAGISVRSTVTAVAALVNAAYTPPGVGAVTRTVSAKLNDSISVKDFGAVGDGVTDDLLAFQNALSSNQLVYVPPTANGYRLSAGITIVPGVTLLSDCFLPGNPVVGTKLIFDLGVAICVTLGGPGASNGTPGFIGMSVTRAAGAIPAGSIGILVQDCYNVILRDLFSTRHARTWRFYSSTAVLGLGAAGSNLHSSVATDVHWEFDGWPEFRCMGGRSGHNGLGDVVNNGYIRIQGGAGTGGAGPNTIAFIGFQFNQSANPAGAWLIFNHPTNPGANALEYRFEGCHIENLNAGITSDASTAQISRLQIIGCTFIMASSPFFSLNAATQPSVWEIADNQIFSSTFTLAPTPQIGPVTINNNMISAPGSITGAANSILTLAGNTWGAGLTIAGTGWGDLVVDGDTFSGGTLTLTATGTMSIHLPNVLFGFTPTIGFGASGGTFNGTYSAQVGRYRILNNEASIEYVVNVATKGSTTGQANIGNLPFVANSALSVAAVHVPYVVNMAGLIGGVKGVVSASTNYIQLLQTSAAGDNTLVNDTNCTGTVQVQGSLRYML